MPFVKLVKTTSVNKNTIVIFSISAAWSQQWVGFTRTTPAEPEIVVTHSNNQQVTFTVALPGFFSTLVTEAGVNYQRIVIPGYGVQGKAGEPEMPVNGST